MKLESSNELLFELIQCNSVTPNDAGCQDIIIKRLESIGFECERMNFGKVKNIWAHRQEGNGPLLCFAGHTDVVPPGPLEEWISEPFVPTVRDRMIYGRGAADMKSGLAAMIDATETFIDRRKTFNGKIAFLVTSDEEGPARDGTKKVIEKLTKRNEKIDFCIVGEPSSKKKLGDTIKVGRRGSLSCFLSVIGTQGHSAYPHLANNPFKNIGPVINDLMNHEWDIGNEFFPPTNLEIVDASTNNNAINVIPGEVTITMNIRFNNLWNYDSLKNKISKIIDHHKIRYKLKYRESGEPFLSKEGPLLKASKNAIENVLGIKPELSTDGGTSDGRFIAPTGAEVIEIGSINSSIHKVNECVPFEDTPNLSRVYSRILEKLIR